MIRICTTGENYSILRDYEVTGSENTRFYDFPENEKSPWEQIAWFNDNLSDFVKDDSDIVIKTMSPYILNLLNLKLYKKEIEFDKLSVDILTVEDDGCIEVWSLKITDAGGQICLVDTSEFSAPISWIYDEINRITGNGTEDDEGDDEDDDGLDIKWINMETKEAHCYDCCLFENGKCKDMSLCKNPTSTFQGFYVKKDRK